MVLKFSIGSICKFKFFSLVSHSLEKFLFSYNLQILLQCKGETYFLCPYSLHHIDIHVYQKLTEQCKSSYTVQQSSLKVRLQNQTSLGMKFSVLLLGNSRKTF